MKSYLQRQHEYSLDLIQIKKLRKQSGKLLKQPQAQQSADQATDQDQSKKHTK